MSSRNRNIQILRGISVLSIVLYHGFPKTFSAGYLGVDLFFLISGFVIAPKIEKIIHSNNSWCEMRTFFVSRFWRLTPALLVTLIFSLLFIFLFGGVGHIKNSLLQAFFTTILLGNVSAYYFLGDYFQPIPNPLVHTWSLSLEEQIYIFTPLVFLLLSRLFKIKKAVILYFLMFSISLVFLFLAPKLGIERFSFYSPLARYWEFCLGAIIFFTSRAMQIEKRQGGVRLSFISFGPLFLLIYLILFGPHNPLYIFLTTVLFIRFIFYYLEFALPKVLGSVACYIGDRSYSIYLVHMPIIWIFSYSPIFTSFGDKEKNPILIFISILLTFFLGSFLYKSIEFKYRDSSYRLNLGKYVVLYRSILVFVCLFGIIGTGLFAGSQHFWLERTVLNRPVNQMDFSQNEKCYLMNEIQPCVFGSNEQYDTLLIGDSHAGSLALTLRDFVNGTANFHTFLASGCQFISDRVFQENFNNVVNTECITKSKNITKYVKQIEFETIYVSYRSTSLIPLGLKISELKYRNMLFQSLLDLQKTCSCKIILIGPTPEFPLSPDYFNPNRLLIQGNENAPRLVNRRFMRSEPFSDDLYWKTTIYNSVKEIEYLSLIDTFCNEFHCTRWKGGWLYSDADHLSSLGAEIISEILRG